MTTLYGIHIERRARLFLLGDLVLLLVALFLGHALRFGPGEHSLLSILQVHTGASLIFISTTLLFLYVAEAYDPRHNFGRRILLFRLWGALAIATVAQMVAFYLLPDWWWGRGVTLLSNLCFAALLTVWRVGISQLGPQVQPLVRTLILGENPAGQALAEAIRDHPDPDLAYEMLGFIDRHKPLAEAIAAHRADCVIVSELGMLDAGLAAQLLACKSAGLRVEDMPTVYKRLTGKVPIYYLSDSTLIFGPQFAGTRGIGLAAQRVADIVIALVGITLSLPVLLIAAVAIKSESPGPVLFTQERIGRNEVPFTIFKLRTMGADAEAKTGPVWSKGARDVRVTRVGRFLRRSRIDELPQFFNVLRGDMAVIGPRPERGFFVDRLKEKIPYFGLRAAVKPGVTGWAQVKYRYGATDEDAAEKLCYDLYAIQELSLPLYILILIKTVQTVLFKPGS
ncbi:MAG: exopolysaccharide biosynthesis polyprenyl glycosylphosphotransferase [Myxococcota bacterium]|jgi:exopolysaccharide biosynthesis polyprenyl glycosylphosphotransferase